MLEVEHLAKSFGPVAALRDISLTVAAGRNPCRLRGKRCWQKHAHALLMGVSRPDAGLIKLDGRNVAVENPQDAQRFGIALVAQELSLAPHLSVLDNIWLGNRRVPLFHRRKEFRQRAAAALSTPWRRLRSRMRVSRLTMGQQQIVEIARLLVRDARVLILDEPTATLSDVEIDRLMAVFGS